MSGESGRTPSLFDRLAFGRLARGQYSAFARMRWQMQLHALHTRRGRFELAARVIATGFFTCMWLGIGGACGVAAFRFTSAGHLGRLSLLLWPVLILWQALPVMLASAQGGSDLGLLNRFPVSFGSFALLYLCSGVFDLSSQMGGIAVLGIVIGAAVAKPAAAIWIAPALVLFAGFNLLLTRMIFSWIERWLARRKTREILGMVFLAFFLSLQLLNPAFHRASLPPHATLLRAMHVAASVQRFFPPGLTALSIESEQNGQYSKATALLGGVLLYAAAAGALLSFRLHSEFRGENLGEAAAATNRPQSLRRATERSDARSPANNSSWLDGPIGGVLVKEIQYLLRSGVMLFGLITPLIFIFASGRSMSSRGAGFRYAFPLAVAYGFLPLTRQVSNSLGTEGAGIQIYFLSPTPFRSVMLAKNIVQAGLLGLELAMVSTVAIVRFGAPDPQLALATLGWLLFALPANLAAGNVLSITMAYRMTLTRIAREQGSVGNGLLSLLVQLMLFAVGAAVYLALGRFHQTAWCGPVFVLLAVGSVSLWLRILSNTDIMAARRREALLSILVRPA